MDKRKLTSYLQDRIDLYLEMANQAKAKDNDYLFFSYMMVVDEFDRLIFVVNFEKEEEKINVK